MHEWALAEAVITTAFQIAEKENLEEIIEVNIKLGELQQVDLDIFKFALSQLKPPLLKNAKFNVTRMNAKFKCRACGHEWSFNDVTIDEDAREAIHFVPEIAHTYVKCPRCGSPDFEVLQGRGVWIDSVVGAKRDD